MHSKGLLMKNNFFHITTIVLILCITACTSPKDNTVLFKEAESLFRQGQLSTATINLKNILQKDPQHLDARFMLGKIYLFNDNFLGAEKEFRRVLKDDAANESAILLLAKTQLLLNQTSEALNTLQNVSFSDDDERMHALLIGAKANLSLKEIEPARNLIQQAIQINEQSQYSLLGKALIFSYDEEQEKALEILTALTVSNSKLTDAWLLKGSIHSNIKQYSQAAESYLKYFELKPHNFAIQTLVAHNYIRAGKFDLARPHIEKLVKINDKHPTVNLLAAQLAFSEKNYDQAKELSNEVVNATNNGLAQMISGLSSFYLEEHEQAYYQLNAIADHLPKSHQVHKILAVLQVKLGYTDGLSETLSELTNVDALLYANLGQEYVKKGDTESAQEMLNKAAALAPDNAQIKAQLGMLKLSKADDSGLKELEQAVALDPQFKSANIILAMSHVKKGEIDKAEKIAQLWLKENPESISALILNGNIALKAKKTEKAKEFFNTAFKIDSSNVVPLFNLAIIAAENKNYAHSNELLNKILSIDIEYPFTYPLAISNAVAEGKDSELEQKFIQIINEHSSAVWPRIILSRRYTAKGEFSKSIETLNELNEYQNLPTVYFQALANTLVLSGQTVDLVNMYQKWQTAQPENDKAFLSHIDFLDKQKNYQNALMVTNNALSLSHFKSHFQLLSLQAYYLLATKQFELASQKINNLVEIEPAHAFVLRLQGQVAMARSQYSEAINFLEESYKKNAKDNTAIFLVNSYKLSGKTDDAINLLEQLLDNSPQNTTFTSLLAELYINKSPNKAINKYKELLENEPNNAIAYNNLAWVYYQQENYQQALKYVNEAIKIIPEHPQILDTLGIILTKRNELAKAIQTLKLAKKLAPKNDDITLHLAQAYQANNQNELAEQLLNK